MTAPGRSLDHSVDQPDLARMEEERDHLLASIEDLDRERSLGELADADYEELRRGYTARAAAVLRAIDQARAGQGRDGDAADLAPAAGAVADRVAPAGAAPAAVLARAGAGAPAPEPSRSRSQREVWRRRIAVVAAGVAAAAAVVLAIGLSGSSGAGGGRGASAPVPDSRVVARDLSSARALLAKGDDGDALKLYDQVLQSVPQQAEALAYRGWILRQAGVAAHDQSLLAAGRSSVESSVAADPTYPDAHAFLGYIRYEDQHDVHGAVEQFRQFLADHPPAQMVALAAPVVAQAFAADGEPVPPASSPGPY